MSAMLSFAESPLLLNFVGKPPFVHPMNKRQVTTARTFVIHVWNFVECELQLFGLYKVHYLVTTAASTFVGMSVKSYCHF